MRENPLGESITKSERDKLLEVERDAQRNVQSDWNATTGDAQILNKPTIPATGSAAAKDVATATTDIGLSSSEKLIPGKLFGTAAKEDVATTLNTGNSAYSADKLISGALVGTGQGKIPVLAANGKLPTSMLSLPASTLQGYTIITWHVFSNSSATSRKQVNFYTNSATTRIIHIFWITGQRGSLSTRTFNISGREPANFSLRPGENEITLELREV